MRRVNLPRGSVDDLNQGIGCVELLAHLNLPSVRDKKASTFVDVTFHPLKPWVATIEAKGCGIVWNYETAEIVAEFDVGESHILDEDEGTEMTEVPGGFALPKGLLTRSPSMQGAASAAKGLLLSPTGASLSKLRQRTMLPMLFYDHEAIACTTQLPASRTCYDEWLIVVTRSRIVICDLDQNGAVHHLDPEDLHRGLPSSIAILPTGLLAIGCQDGKIRIWSPWQSKIVGTLDTGSQRDVQQLILLTTPPILMKRSGSGSLPETETRLSTQLHHLACATLDGYVVTWKISLNPSTASCDCVKTSELELRDVFRQFDTVNGVHELKFHPQHDVMTASCRDGTIFFFDVAPLLDSNRPATLIGLLPTSKLQSVIILPGAQKGCFTALSIAPINSALIASDIMIKGRYCGKDNVPTIFTEFVSNKSQESRDLRAFIKPMSTKKLKIMSLASSLRNAGELCCLTSSGLLVLRTCFSAAPMPVLIPRNRNPTPAIAFPSSMFIAVRVLGGDSRDKPQLHIMQNDGTESKTPAAIERFRVPQLHYCPWQNGFLAALLPTSGYLEILQVGHKPIPPNAVDFETIFVAHAFALAWHPSQPLFAVLAPNKELVGKLTRANTSSAIIPSKRSRFFFGGSKASAANASDEPESRQERASLALSIYQLSSDDDAEVTFLGTSFSSGKDNVLHVFSGPLLGVVKFVRETTPVDSEPLLGGGSMVKRERDGAASLSRVQRAQSFMLSLSTISSPKMSDLRLTMISPSQSPSASPTAASFESADSASDLSRTFLEFYEWSHFTDSTDAELELQKLRGGIALDCPLTLEWDTFTRSLCALVYPTSLKIYHFDMSSSTSDGKESVATAASTMKLWHDIPTPSPALSLHWMHHTLFFTTEDEVKCCIISPTRCFTLALASRWVLNEASCATQVSDDDLNQYPRPQIFPAGATTILGVRDQKLVLGGPLQTVHILDLSNRVLQCALIVTAGVIDGAVEMAQRICRDAIQWLGAVFEAFGYISEALRLLPGLSLSLKVNICIKHVQLEFLSNLLPEVIENEHDSPNLSGSSLFQRLCIALYRGNMHSSLKDVGFTLLAQKRVNDAIFVATLLDDKEQLVRAYKCAEEWGAAFFTVKAKPSATMATQDAMLQKWNAHIANPTAAWRKVLKKQGIRAPTTVKLQTSSSSA